MSRIVDTPKQYHISDVITAEPLPPWDSPFPGQVMASYGEGLQLPAWGVSQPRYMGQEESARELTRPGTDLSVEHLVVNICFLIP